MEIEKSLPFATDLDRVLNNFANNIEISTNKAKTYYGLSDEERCRDRFQVMAGNLNPSFNETELLKELCVCILSIITTLNSDILSVGDLDILKLFIKNRVKNRQYGKPDKNGDIVFASGTTCYNALYISFSNEKMRNIVCISHELGHLIISIKVPDEQIKSLWGKDDILQEDIDIIKKWYEDNIAKKDNNLCLAMLHIEELIADFFTLGILAACNIAEYGTLITILKEVSDDLEHNVPRKALITLLNSSQVDNVDWFEKACEAIKNYYCQPVTSFEDFFCNLFGSEQVNHHQVS